MLDSEEFANKITYGLQKFRLLEFSMGDDEKGRKPPLKNRAA